MVSSAKSIEKTIGSKKKQQRILIVDDDIASCRTLQLHLNSQDHLIALAHSVDEGLEVAQQLNPDLIILDIRMPGKSGLEGLPEFKQTFPMARIIMITAFHDMQTTIQAMQLGADEYIHKPVDIDELDNSISQLLNKLKIDDLIQTETGTKMPATGDMIGHSHAMKEIFKTIGLIASSPVTVLITGESGTGKELVARAIHRASNNFDSPFVAINCAALVDTLLESDMFGHEKGSFTGAISRQPGKFELANNGTIFLDEIGELSLNLQAKLLRVLQEKEFTPIGAKESRKTNARVIAATNIDLSKHVDKSEFRDDLYYRLKVVTIHVPPLRERKEEIFALVQTLLQRINHDMNRNITLVTKEVFTCFENYDWPGNIRELENLLTKAVALCSGNTITSEFLSQICDAHQNKTSTSNTERPLSEWSLSEVEHAHVLRILNSTSWHKGRCCEILGISRPRLRRMIQQYKLTPPKCMEKDEELEEVLSES